MALMRSDQVGTVVQPPVHFSSASDLMKEVGLSYMGMRILPAAM